jgi:aminopeptidase N
VNLDSVGRLGQGKVLVLGCGTASEWPHVFRGAGFVTGIPVEPVAADPGGSDQVSFQERGVPAVQLFTGPHADWHAPGDTPDKVDVPGIAKVTAVAREAVAYLASRPEPLTRNGAAPAGGGGEGRRVALGTVPDFAFAGPGVRLEGVVPGSPAEQAGLAAGDVLVELGGEAIADLRGYSAALKRLSPGDRVEVAYVRDGVRRAVQVEVVAR